MKLQSLAKSMESFVLKARAYLHANPELRWQENETIDFVRNGGRIGASENLTPLDIKIQDRYQGGLVVDLGFEKGLDRIIFRADIDALPVQEETGLPYASVVPGKMHACGHDVHTAMLLGAYRALVTSRIKCKHNIRFVFQRAEENPGTPPNPKSGGQTLVEEGVLEGISHAYGLHIWNSPDSTPGVFYSRPGPFMGNSGRLKIAVKASGGHVAKPSGGVNVLRITQAIQNTLDGYLARTLGPFEPAALEPAILKAGTGSNVMPAEAEMWYGVRTVLPGRMHELYMVEIEETIRSVVFMFPGASVQFERILGHPALINDTKSYKHVESVLLEANQITGFHERILGGEDFAHYLDAEYGVPGSFWFLGARKDGTGDHHAPTFNPDESVFWKGVLFWLLLATN
jgi:amidohydrolase